MASSRCFPHEVQPGQMFPKSAPVLSAVQSPDEGSAPDQSQEVGAIMGRTRQ